MPYKVWRDVVYSMYWNKWKADTIQDQSVANMVVDWVWHSGAATIKNKGAASVLDDYNDYGYGENAGYADNASIADASLNDATAAGDLDD